MNKQWSKPKLFNLGVEMTEEDFGKTGADQYWDGIAGTLTPSKGSDLMANTGS